MLTINDLEEYKKTLRVGDKKVIEILDRNRDKWKRTMSAESTSISKNNAMVKYVYEWTDQGKTFRTLVHESFTIKELMLFDNKRRKEEAKKNV